MSKDKNTSQLSAEEIQKFVEILKQADLDKRIAQRHKEDEDSMNAVQWTDWEFRG